MTLDILPKNEIEFIILFMLSPFFVLTNTNAKFDSKLSPRTSVIVNYDNNFLFTPEILKILCRTFAPSYLFLLKNIKLTSHRTLAL